MSRRVVCVSVCSVLAGVFGGSVVSAQASASGTWTSAPLTRPTAAARGVSVVSMANPCSQDDAALTQLARLPEGAALLRMRRELEAAAGLHSMRSTQSTAATTLALQPVTRMRFEVDSLASVIESVVLAAPRRGELVRNEIEQRSAVTMRVRELAPLVDHEVELALARVSQGAPRAPAGYMGVTVSSVPLRQSLRAGYIVSYCEYPVVLAVDAGSPAERAGIQAGDTIIAFNGQDVRAGMVDWTSLLTPNSLVRVRTQRSGTRRDVTVRVQAKPTPASVRVQYARTPGAAPLVPLPASAPTSPRAPMAPGSFVFETMLEPTVVYSMMRSGGQQFTVTGDSVFSIMLSSRSEPGAVWGVAPLTVSGMSAAPTPNAVRGVAPPTVAGMSAAPTSWLSFATTNEDAMLFGAQLKTLGAELRSALSLPEGVLVLQVLPRTPAADGGLRDGDVIRAANGLVVRRVGDLRTAYERAGEGRTMVLRVVRGDAAERTVTMRW